MNFGYECEPPKTKGCRLWGIREFIFATCPYCGWEFQRNGYYEIGDLISCHKCNRQFKLSKPIIKQ